MKDELDMMNHCREFHSGFSHCSECCDDSHVAEDRELCQLRADLATAQAEAVHERQLRLRVAQQLEVTIELRDIAQENLKAAMRLAKYFKERVKENHAGILEASKEFADLEKRLK